ncbi:MAG TPA: DUF2283 domain-containing protein [Bacteroidota bacterium]
MEKVKVYYDRKASTLTVWFGNPHDEYISEETGEEIVLMKNNSGKVIGFEKLNYSLPASEQFQIAFETVTS